MKMIKFLSVLIGLAAVFSLSSCWISDVIQSAQVNTGGTFTATLTISEMTAENSTPHKGILCVLVPDDWTFASGTYTTTLGSGAMLLNTDPNPVYGDIDTIIPPPAGMKWVDLISETGYLHPANFIMETTVNFNVGTTTGTFPIGYAATKNTLDMMTSFNMQEADNDMAWTDTSMNHMVVVAGGTDVEEQLSGIPSEFNLSQNYPNPFNPATRFTYSLKNSGDVQISVYDLSGKEVKTLVKGFRAAGTYEVNFEAENLGSGIYYYRIITPEFTTTNKMILLK